MRRPLHALLAAVLAVVLVATGCAGSRPNLTSQAPPIEVDLTQGKVASEAPAVDLSVVATATVGEVAIFDAPAGTEPTRSLPNPNENGAPLVFLVEQARDGWLEVLLPVRPNGSTGWVRADDVTLARHSYAIEVRLSEYRLVVTHGGAPVLDTTIGVANDNTPTPGGRYYTTELLKPPTPDTVYGTYAYGLSGFSETFETFNGGPGQLGIHGTNDPSGLGQKVSAGCIRMHNDDIDRLAAFLPLGVPVTIIA